MKKRKRIGTTPLTRWLLNYVDAQDTNLSELALQAHLSTGYLHDPINYSECAPTLETCLWLPMASRKSIDERFQITDLDGYEPMKNLNLDRLELLRSYQELPRQMRHTLCMIAQVLEESISPKEYRETPLFLFGPPIPAIRNRLRDVVLAAAGETNE